MVRFVNSNTLPSIGIESAAKTYFTLSGLFERHPVNKSYTRLRRLQLSLEPPPAMCQIKERLPSSRAGHVLCELLTTKGVFATFFGITRHGSRLQE